MNYKMFNGYVAETWIISIMICNKFSNYIKTFVIIQTKNAAHVRVTLHSHQST